jgi:hypothetical protein
LLANSAGVFITVMVGDPQEGVLRPADRHQREGGGGSRACRGSTNCRPASND